MTSPGESHKSPSGFNSLFLAVGTACLTASLLGGAHAVGKAVEASTSFGAPRRGDEQAGHPGQEV